MRGVSRRVAASEKDVPDAKLEAYIVSWPGRVPKAARKRGAVKSERGGEGKENRREPNLRG